MTPGFCQRCGKPIVPKRNVRRAKYCGERCKMLVRNGLRRTGGKVGRPRGQWKPDDISEAEIELRFAAAKARFRYARQFQQAVQ